MIQLKPARHPPATASTRARFKPISATATSCTPCVIPSLRRIGFGRFGAIDFQASHSSLANRRESARGLRDLKNDSNYRNLPLAKTGHDPDLTVGLLRSGHRN